MKQASELRAEAREALKGMWGSSALRTLVYLLSKGVISAIAFMGILLIIVILLYTQVISAPGAFVLGLCLFLLIPIILLPIDFGFYVSFLKQLRKIPQDMGCLLSEFKGRVYLTMILKSLYICLWALLFFIPGIIKAYSYSMTYYVMADNPELSGNEAIDASRHLMKGHKWQLFYLHLTFIGWGAVAYLPYYIFLSYAYLNGLSQNQSLLLSGQMQPEAVMDTLGMSAINILLFLWMFVASLFLTPYIQTAQAAFYEDLKSQEA